MDGTLVKLTHKGKRTIHTRQGTIRLSEVYYAKELQYNLVSVPAMAEKGVNVTFGENKAFLEKNGNRITLRKIDGLWALPEEKKTLKMASLRMQRNRFTDAETWHQRLGHIGTKKIDKMIKNDEIPQIAAGFDAANCETCQLTHPGRRPVPKIAERSGNITVQVDYMPMGQTEEGWKGEVGAYVYSSRSSKIVKVYPVKDVSTESALNTLKMYCKNIVPFLKEKVDCVQTDAGTQFNTRQWKEVCTEYNMVHRTCPVDHQAMNGQVERVIGVLAAKTRALLMDKDVEQKYWPLALETAACLFNRKPHESLNGMSPLQKITGRKPDHSRLRVFGCKAYVQIPKPQRKRKLSNTAWIGAMVGYSTQSPEWTILDTRTGRLRSAYSVVFNEHESGFASVDKNRTKEETLSEKGILGEYITDGNELSESKLSNENVIPVETENVEKNTEHETENLATEAENRDPGSPTNSLASGSADERSDSSWEAGRTSKLSNQSSHCPRRGARARRKFNPSHMPSGTLEMKRLNDQIENDSISSESEVLDSPTDEREQMAEAIPCLAMISNDVDLPRTWRQALGMQQWETAMENEIKELKNKSAWELVPRSKDITVLPGVWNFRIKRDENGKIIKHKARWCVDGSREGLNRPPENVFSPVAELPTIRTLVSIAAKDKQIILQADFPNAYVNADIEEDIYVCQPKGLEEMSSNQYVCKLKKALYGCPISGKRWNDTLTRVILSLGYRQSVIDHCLFYREKNDIRDLLVIYVDDVLATSSGGRNKCDDMLNELSEIFKIKKLGKASHILGLGIHQESDGTFLEQRAYVESILEEAGYLEAKTRNTPWDSHLVEDYTKLYGDGIATFRRALG